MAMSKRNSNANQQLISISREVLTILQDCLEGAESPLVVKFQAAIAAAEAKPIKERCILCDDPIDPKTQIVVADAYVKKGFKPAFAHTACHYQHQEDNRAFADWCDAKRASEAYAPVFNRYAASKCACGHNATQHKEDELENLLQCEACDCDHFHYNGYGAIEPIHNLTESDVICWHEGNDYCEDVLAGNPCPNQPIELKESEAMEAVA